MLNRFITAILCLCMGYSYSQSSELLGELYDESDSPIMFTNIVLYNALDSTVVKVETTDDKGKYRIRSLNAGKYYLNATYIGYDDLIISDIDISEDQVKDLGKNIMTAGSFELAEAVVTAARALIEIKPDRTVFNVHGTINSAGSDAIELLRKAPGVTVDNNDNINVLGRGGVMLYVDGKRMPLTGDDLTNYLQNLPAEQIDRIDIITNPGAKYEAEGNAGIIDIRLKKDKSIGANGTINGTYSKGDFGRGNMNGSANYRNKNFNIFSSGGIGKGTGAHNTNFNSFQNNIQLIETNKMTYDYEGYSLRVGTDFFIDKNHTIGLLYDGRGSEGERRNANRISIAQATNENIDSILIANNSSQFDRSQNTFNLNYRFIGNSNESLNIDVDYGQYRTVNDNYQPNVYFDQSETEELSSVINSYQTPTEIDIYTFKVDYETEVLGGKFGIGSKLSKVNSDNTYKFFNVIDGEYLLNNRQSNRFDYDENVYAAYVNYSHSINDKWGFSAGLRAEQTDANGDLQAFDSDLSEPPVTLNYLSWFPNAGLTYSPAQNHSFSFNYGRRINRPDYNVLNPFNYQLSEISFEKGNPFLSPEIVNNFEMGYTYAYKYNFKLAYSKTSDQITRLIAPDEMDERANSISWANLSDQTIFSFSASTPIQIKEKWNMYTNFSASYLDNQADYGNGAVVDVQAFSYNIYQQHTIDLPKGLKGEISGYYSGPGVWGGVFEYEATWSLNLGLQRKFFADQMNVRLSFNDLFFQSGWEGFSEFNGLYSEGNGNWDSRRGSISISYNFGNQNVKSRNRKTGIEDEAGRVGESN